MNLEENAPENPGPRLTKYEEYNLELEAALRLDVNLGEATLNLYNMTSKLSLAALHSHTNRKSQS